GFDPLAGDDGALRGPVVDGIERAEAPLADPDGIEGIVGLADPATKCGGGHYIRPFVRGSASDRDWHHARCAGCRGVTGPVPSASLDAERDVPVSLVRRLYKIKLTRGRLLVRRSRPAARSARARPS